jgi:hypothetical protein
VSITTIALRPAIDSAGKKFDTLKNMNSNMNMHAARCNVAEFSNNKWPYQ